MTSNQLSEDETRALNPLWLSAIIQLYIFPAYSLKTPNCTCSLVLTQTLLLGSRIHITEYGMPIGRVFTADVLLVDFPEYSFSLLLIMKAQKCITLGVITAQY